MHFQGTSGRRDVAMMILQDALDVLPFQVSDRHRFGSDLEETGVNADVDNSAGTFVYLSPGIAYQGAKRTQLYGLIQIPVYHNLDGWQLAPRWTATTGISHAF